MKIKITENDNVKEVEVSLGLSPKSKSVLKALAEKAVNAVLNTSVKAVQKVNLFFDKIAEEETRDFREHMNEVVEQVKEDANRMVENAMRDFLPKKEEKNNTEKATAFLRYLNKLVYYKCHSDSSNKTEEARKFMKSIVYPITPCSIQAFEKVLLLNGIISYENIAEEICNSEMDNEEIIETLQVEFNIWLNRNPHIKDEFPDASLIDLLKCFKNKFYNEDESIEDETENNTSCKAEDDDHPDEVEEETLAEKIAKIPEGKTFTLAEYLDYTEEYKYDKIMQPYSGIAIDFLRSIKFPCTGNTINAFAKMLTIKKPSYKELAYAMSGYYNEGMIEYLKKNFEFWLNERSDVKKYCPKATLWQLLIYFKKKVNESLLNNF